MRCLFLVIVSIFVKIFTAVAHRGPARQVAGCLAAPLSQLNQRFLEKRYYERHKRSLIFCLKTKSGLPLDKNGFMLNPRTNQSRIVRFKNQEDKP